MKKIFPVLALLFVIMGCTEELESPQQHENSDELIDLTFTAALENSLSKTVNDGLWTSWADGDVLRLYRASGTAYTKSGDFKTSASALGTFTGQIQLDDVGQPLDWMVLYQYDTELSDPVVTFPSEIHKSNAESAIAHLAGANVPLAGFCPSKKADQLEFTMQPLSAVMKLTVTNGSETEIHLKTVELTSSVELSGKFIPQMTSDAWSLKPESGNGKSVCLFLDSGITLQSQASTTVYIPFRACKIPTGEPLTLRVNDYSKTITFENGFEFKAGQFTPANITYTNVIGTHHATSSQMNEYTGRAMFGYQGWFRWNHVDDPSQNDGSQSINSHYKLDGSFEPGYSCIEYWPYVEEYDNKYNTAFKNPDGTPAQVNSSYDAQVIDTHFRWMKEYGIDGAMMQRFINNILNITGVKEEFDAVLTYAKNACEKYDRAFAVMYDLSSWKSSDRPVAELIADWKHLVDDLHITSSPDNHYLYHNKKPLVAIWGVGFASSLNSKYAYTLDDIQEFIDFLKTDKEYGGCSVMFGVPWGWRTVEWQDSKYENPKAWRTKLDNIYKQADIISPWSHTANLEGFEKYKAKERLNQDLEWCKQNRVDFAPTIHPGGCGYNRYLQINPPHVHYMTDETVNAGPIGNRLKGKYFWTQVHDFWKAMYDKGMNKMFYYAMFDEINEGTQYMKIDITPPSPKDNPSIASNGRRSWFLDYEGLPEDHYLWLAGRAREFLVNGQIPPETVPERGSIKTEIGDWTEDKIPIGFE